MPRQAGAQAALNLGESYVGGEASGGDEKASTQGLELGDMVSWLNEAGELMKWKVTFIHQPRR